jgi:hypothetical protein
MIKRLLTNWINLLGYLFGFFLITLFIAITQFFKYEKQISIESVFVDTLGGSLLFSIGAVIYNIYILVFFLIFLLGIDLILLKKIGFNIQLLINIEIIFFIFFFIFISIYYNSYNYLILIFTFIISQQIRKRKLKYL